MIFLTSTVSVILISIGVFLFVILLLVVMLLYARYKLTPQGDVQLKVNDKEFINFTLGMQPEKMLSTAEKNYNACGAGAAAAAVAAAKELGRTQGILLAHTDSNTIMAEKMSSGSSESVGYAAIVF